jgi:hypothetical protein
VPGHLPALNGAQPAMLVEAVEDQFARRVVGWPFRPRRVSITT